jgi:hypothetical protein
MKGIKMSIEFWHAVFQWGSVGLVAITFVFVAGALWTSNLIHDRQSARLLLLETGFAKAQTSLREQQERTANADKAFPEPPERARPRTLDASARATLLDSLSRVHPEGPLEIRFVSAGTTEPAAFARALANVIEEARWTLTESDSGGPAFGTPPVGLLVQIPEIGDVPPRALILQEALNRAGMGARIERVSTVKDGGVELMVGLKP